MSIEGNLPPQSDMIVIVLGVLVITTTNSIQSATAGGRNEYCPGFIDKHGQWNNGFECPKWGEPGQGYCCGTDSHRFCCPTQQLSAPLHTTARPTEPTKLHHHVLLVTFVFGTLILFTGTAVIMCFYCRCCLVYQRRKRSHRAIGNPIQRSLANRRHTWGFDRPTASNRTIQPEFIALRPPSYQEDEPPAYDDLSVPHTSKEKNHEAFDQDSSESPKKHTSTGLCRINNDKKRFSFKRKIKLIDFEHQASTPSILASNQRHSANASHHSVDATIGRKVGESNSTEASKEQLIIGRRQKERPSGGGIQKEQPFNDRRLETGCKSGESQSCSISFAVSASTMNKCHTETEDDMGCLDGCQLVSQDCFSKTSASMVSESENELKNSGRSNVNRCR